MSKFEVHTPHNLNANTATVLGSRLIAAPSIQLAPHIQTFSVTARVIFTHTVSSAFDILKWLTPHTFVSFVIYPTSSDLVTVYMLKCSLHS